MMRTLVYTLHLGWFEFRAIYGYYDCRSPYVDVSRILKEFGAVVNKAHPFEELDKS